jgi:hypothetical protein
MKKKLLIFFIFAFAICTSQISQKWDNYYNKNPSGIENNYSAKTFIEVINYLSFQSKTYKPDSDFKKMLLMLPYEYLRQMMITGNYYSRTIKHDDYFLLYNMSYNEISKENWDIYAPFLLPLMEIDGVVRFR